MRWFRRIPIWGWVLAVLILFMTPPVVVSSLEEKDSFCASCHTAPETTYYDRAHPDPSQGMPSKDLASFHYAATGNTFRCIDCHRGSGSLPHRIQTLALGLKDTVIWISGQGDESIEKLTTGEPGLVEASCLKCHTASLLVAGFNNHFHNMMPAAYQAWQAGGVITAPQDGSEADTSQLHPSDTGVTCLDCHQAHRHLPGSEFQYYLDVPGAVYPACVACHQDVQQGPQTVEELGG